MSARLIGRADNMPGSHKGRDARWPDAAYDDGNYRYYAGAVYITGTNGKCISV